MEQILPQRLQKEAFHLTPWFQTCGSQNCERISLCCFNLSNLLFIIAALGNYYRFLHSFSESSQGFELQLPTGLLNISFTGLFFLSHFSCSLIWAMWDLHPSPRLRSAFGRTKNKTCILKELLLPLTPDMTSNIMTKVCCPLWKPINAGLAVLLV